MKILVIANFVVFPWEGGNNRFIYLSNMINHKKNKVELITSNFFHSKKKHRDLKENKLNYQITLLDEPGYKKMFV